MTEKRRRRIFLWTIPWLLLLTLLAGIKGQADGQCEYRALLVTRGDYRGASSDLTPGPQNDGENIRRMLVKAYGVNNITVSVKEQDGVTTKSGLKQTIQDSFGASKPEDVNYFYYSGHGEPEGLCLELGTILTPEELYDCFEGIEGTNILIMDCCYSGGFSGLTLSAQSEDDTQEDGAGEFANWFVEEFEKEAAARPQTRTVLNNSRFRMLLAASEEEVSNQTIETADIPSVGMFTSSVAYGAGIDAMKLFTAQEETDYALGQAPADLDQDGSISFNEMYRFVQNCCVANHVRMYPSDNEECFLPGTMPAAEVTFEKASVSYEVDKTPVVKVSYRAQKEVTLELAYYFSTDVWEIQNLILKLTEPTGLPSPSGAGYPKKQAEIKNIRLSEGNGTFSFSLSAAGSEEKTGFYGCLLRPAGSSILYMLPFSVSPAGDSILKNMKLTAADQYCMTNEEEWEITADFGTYSSMALPQAKVSCQVEDAQGNIVRVLGDEETAQVIEEGLSQSYRCYRRFYWDGRDAGGNYVKPGIYTAKVTAEDASGRVVLELQLDVYGDTKPERPTEPDTSAETGMPSTEKKNDQTEPPQTGQQGVQNIVRVNGIAAYAGQKKVTKIVIGKKEKVKIAALLSPANASDKTIFYRSSNTKIVSVKKDGTVQGKKVGNAVITLGSPDGATCRVKVTVKKAPGKPRLNASSKTMKKGKTFRIKVNLAAKTASFRRTFISSNSKVASVTAKGKVKARKKGIAVITVKLYNGKKTKLKITVK